MANGCGPSSPMLSTHTHTMDNTYNHIKHINGITDHSCTDRFLHATDMYTHDTTYVITEFLSQIIRWPITVNFPKTLNSRKKKRTMSHQWSGKHTTNYCSFVFCFSSTYKIPNNDKRKLVSRFFFIPRSLLFLLVHIHCVLCCFFLFILSITNMY